MPAALRRLLTWIVVLFGALLVLVGLIDIAIGPDAESMETGVELAETASRWTGLIYIAFGAAIIAVAMHVENSIKKG